MPEETFETPQPASEPKSTNWPKIILAAVAAFTLLATATYAGYYYGIRQAQPAGELTPETPNPTADWETYTNTKYGYSIEYPSDWSVHDRSVDDSTSSSYSVIDFVPTSFLESKPEPYAYLRIGLEKENNTLGLRGWFEEYTEQVLNPLQLIQNAQDLELNNRHFIVTTRNVALHGDERLYFTQHGPEVYSIEFVLPSDACYVGGSEDRPKFMSIFDLMLSTFKFL